MKIEFLGTGSGITIPQPGCHCRLCDQARVYGLPYSRTGPSLFVHDLGLLIDTPEESKYQLNRAGIDAVEACLYSHWHPDHVMGRRVWEINMDWLNWPPQNRRSTIYLPEQVAQDFRTTLGTWEHLSYFEQQELVHLVELSDGDVVQLAETRIQPLRLAADYAYAFLFEEGSKRILIAPDELAGWDPASHVCGLDLAILPMGIVEFDPLTGSRRIPADHPILTTEATFRQTLEMVRKLDASQIYMVHIEEPDGQSYDDLLRLEVRLKDEGLNICFAYDTLVIEV